VRRGTLYDLLLPCPPGPPLPALLSCESSSRDRFSYFQYRSSRWELRKRSQRLARHRVTSHENGLILDIVSRLRRAQRVRTIRIKSTKEAGERKECVKRLSGDELAPPQHSATPIPSTLSLADPVSTLPVTEWVPVAFKRRVVAAVRRHCACSADPSLIRRDGFAGREWAGRWARRATRGELGARQREKNRIHVGRDSCYDEYLQEREGFAINAAAAATSERQCAAIRASLARLVFSAVRSGEFIETFFRFYSPL